MRDPYIYIYGTSCDSHRCNEIPSLRNACTIHPPRVMTSRHAPPSSIQIKRTVPSFSISSNFFLSHMFIGECVSINSTWRSNFRRSRATVIGQGRISKSFYRTGIPGPRVKPSPVYTYPCGASMRFDLRATKDGYHVFDRRISR